MIKPLTLPNVKPPQSNTPKLTLAEFIEWNQETFDRTVTLEFRKALRRQESRQPAPIPFVIKH
jgi:hypothetical protein